MAWPYDDLSVGYFQGLGKLSGDPPDDLVGLLNDLRDFVISNAGQSFPVNPNDPASYATINDAVAAADSILPLGLTIIISLSPYDTHILDGGTLTPPVGRDMVIIGFGIAGIYFQPATHIVGSVSLPDASAEPETRSFGLFGCTLDELHGNSKWNMFVKDSQPTILTKTHGTEGCFLAAKDSRFGVYEELDPRTGNGTSRFDDCDVYQTGPWLLNTGTEIRMKDVRFWIDRNNSTAFDFQGTNAAIFNYGEVNLMFGFTLDTIMTVAKDSAAGQIRQYSGKMFVSCRGYNGVAPIDFGEANYGEEGDAIELFTDEDMDNAEPLNPPHGLLWRNQEEHLMLVWTGSGFWTCGDLRVFLVKINVGIPAASFPIVNGHPQNGPIIKYRINIRKNLTGAGGAVKVGLGTPADPDKYLLSSNLNIGGQSDYNPTWNDGKGVDLNIYACDAAGNVLGTIEGSDDGDVDVVVWLRSQNAYLKPSA